MVPVSGGAPRKIAEGSQPAVLPSGDRIVFLKKNEIWSVGLDENAKPSQLIHTKGHAGELRLVSRRHAPRVRRRAHRTFLHRRLQLRREIAALSRPQRGSRFQPGLVSRLENRSHSCASPPPPSTSSSAPTALLPSPGPFVSPMPIPETAASCGVLPEGPGSAFHAMVADNQLFWGASDRIVFPVGKNRLAASIFHFYSRRRTHAAQHG